MVNVNKIAEPDEEIIPFSDADKVRRDAPRRDNGGRGKQRKREMPHQDNSHGDDDVIMLQRGKLHEHATKAEAILIADASALWLALSEMERSLWPR